MLVLTLAWLAHAPGLSGGFVYDDKVYLLDNPAVQGGDAGWDQALGNPANALWRPITVLSWRAQWTEPPDAGPLRAGNLLLHVLVSLLVLALGRRMGLPSVFAAGAALLFAVHPVHAESVAWITGRSELLAGLFVLAAWLAHLSEHRARAALSLPLLALAILSKENALVAPGLFALGDLALQRTRGRAVPWHRLLALAAVSVALFSVRVAILPSHLPSSGPFLDEPLLRRTLVALSITGRSLSLLLAPHPLRIHYARDEFLGTQPLLLGLTALLAAAVVYFWQRDRRLAALLAGVPVALLPVLHLLPIGEPFAERFLYLPSVPFCLAVGAGLSAWSRREGQGAGASLLLLVAALLASVPLCRSASSRFQDDLALWSHAARVVPELAVVRFNHATFLERAGRWQTEDRHRPGVADELRASLALQPGHRYAGYAHQTLGHLALGALGDGRPIPAAAAYHYRQALAQDPLLLDARQNLAGLALQQPDLVTHQEGLLLLKPLLDDLSLDPARRAALDQLFSALVSASAAAGDPSDPKSSPAGS